MSEKEQWHKDFNEQFGDEYPFAATRSYREVKWFIRDLLIKEEDEIREEITNEINNLRTPFSIDANNVAGKAILLGWKTAIERCAAIVTPPSPEQTNPLKADSSTPEEEGTHSIHRPFLNCDNNPCICREIILEVAREANEEQRKLME